MTHYPQRVCAGHTPCEGVAARRAVTLCSFTATATTAVTVRKGIRVSDTSSLLTVIAAVALFVWWYRSRYQDPQHSSELTAIGLRDLDYIPVTCDHPEHHPDRIPVAHVRSRHVGPDVRDMHLSGWGSTEHTQLCHWHNQGRYPLDLVHIVCGQTGCGTRAKFDAGDPEVGMGELRYQGWCNDRQVPVCPYCAGTRSRTWRR